MKRALILAAALLGGCKDKEPAKQAVPAAPPVAGRAEPRVPRPELPVEPPPAAPAPIDAGEPIDAPPPTKSELALAARAEFFSTVARTSKRGAGNCGALLAELERLAPQARAIAQRRTEVTGAEVAPDDALVNSTLRALTRILSACPQTDRFDAFLDLLGDVPR